METKVQIKPSEWTISSELKECLSISNSLLPVSLELILSEDGTSGLLWMVNERDPSNKMPASVLSLDHKQLLQIYEYLTRVPGV